MGFLYVECDVAFPVLLHTDRKLLHERGVVGVLY
jgi:hypothetical protein